MSRRVPTLRVGLPAWRMTNPGALPWQPPRGQQPHLSANTVSYQIRYRRRGIILRGLNPEMEREVEKFKHISAVAAQDLA